MPSHQTAPKEPSYTFGLLLEKAQSKLSSWGIDPSSLGQQVEKLRSSSFCTVLQAPCLGASPLQTATSSEVAVLHNASYLRSAAQSQAGLLLIHPSLLDSFLSVDRSDRALIVDEKALFIFQAALELFTPPLSFTNFPTELNRPASLQSAKIHPSAKIGQGCTIGEGVVIGEGTRILPGCHIYDGVEIGRDCLIHSGVVIRENCKIFDRVILQPSAIVGSCGFGYSPYQGRHIKLAQIGYVIIEDDVEIGAGCTIDRGHIEPTIIAKGTKIDNLVQIGHGAKIGAHNLIIGQTGIAGSTTTGSYVTLAGQVGVSGHIQIADHCTVAAQSGVTKSLQKPGFYAGTPAVPITQWRKEQVLIKKLEAVQQELKELKRKLS